MTCARLICAQTQRGLLATLGRQDHDDSSRPRIPAIEPTDGRAHGNRPGGTPRLAEAHGWEPYPCVTEGMSRLQPDETIAPLQRPAFLAVEIAHHDTNLRVRLGAQRPETLLERRRESDAGRWSLRKGVALILRR